MKTRDIIYMIYYESEQSITSMGIEFMDFVQSLTTDLTNILLLESGFTGVDFHYGLRLEFVRNEHLEELYKENVYNYGDFCWVDFESIEGLDKLQPHEMAELFYLGHLKKPVNSPFFDTLQNRFAYLAHDDGWGNKTYYREKDDLYDLVRNLFSTRLRSYKKRNVQPLNVEVMEQLLELAKNGLLIDLYKIFKSKNRVEIPLHEIGIFNDFSDVYSHMDRYKAMAKKESRLIYTNKQWKIISY